MKADRNIKVTDKSVSNFNLAAAMVKKNQYEIVEEASEDILKKISEKIKKQNKK